MVARAARQWFNVTAAWEGNERLPRCSKHQGEDGPCSVRLLLGAWALVSVAFVLGWAMRSAIVADRHPSKVRRAVRVQRLGLLGLFTTLAGKLLLGGVAVATVGTLAVDGSLPKPVQDAVSAAGQSIGLEIPSSEDESELRFASPSKSETPLVVRRRILAVMDNWEGERDCEYLRALAQAAGTSPPRQCPREERGEDNISGRGSAPSDLVTPQPPTTESTPPPVEPPPPAEPPPAEPPAEPPPADLEPEEPPPADLPPAEPPPPDSPAPDPPPLAETPPDDPPADPPDDPPADPPPDDPRPTEPPP